ncbi:MAG: hypothetical protein JSV02_00045 [Dehalococcoidia bacterium]|nr:MAG: hypothetical protein JSV02_00045 [Dehalococcoidia bacterium]
MASSGPLLRIDLPTSVDLDADIARLRDIVELFRRFPGDHRVQIAIVTSEGTTNVEMSDLATDYGPDLHRHLVELVDEGNIVVVEGKSEN